MAYRLYRKYADSTQYEVSVHYERKDAAIKALLELDYWADKAAKSKNAKIPVAICIQDTSDRRVISDVPVKQVES